MALNLLRDLIRFASVSDRPNADVARFCGDRLLRLGFEVEEVSYADPRGVEKLNVAAVRPGRVTQTGGFAYFGHTDVVPADRWTGPGGPFEPAVEGGCCYGRGSVDMKGSVAAMLTACGDAAHDAPVYVVLTGDEEAGMHGADAVAERSRVFRRLVEGDATGVIGEPTGGRVVHGHKGVAVFTAAARGRAGHSSTREGDSATLKLIPFLTAARELCVELESHPRWRDDRFEPPTPTPNVLIRDAAPAINVTSAEATARVLVRVSPDLDLAAIETRLREAAGGLAFSVSRPRPAVHRDPSSSAVRELCELTGGDSSTVPYGTDGSCFGDVERLVVLGPGDIAQAHTADEFITLDDLNGGVDLYRRCLARFAGGAVSA